MNDKAFKKKRKAELEKIKEAINKGQLIKFIKSTYLKPTLVKRKKNLMKLIDFLKRK